MGLDITVYAHPLADLNDGTAADSDYQHNRLYLRKYYPLLDWITDREESDGHDMFSCDIDFPAEQLLADMKNSPEMFLIDPRDDTRPDYYVRCAEQLEAFLRRALHERNSDHTRQEHTFCMNIWQ